MIDALMQRRRGAGDVSTYLRSNSRNTRRRFSGPDFDLMHFCHVFRRFAVHHLTDWLKSRRKQGSLLARFCRDVLCRRVRFEGVGSTGQCNTAWSLSADHSISGHHACIAAIRRMVSSFSGRRLEQPAYNLIDNDTNDV
jgi:hypothetical protein